MTKMTNLCILVSLSYAKMLQSAQQFDGLLQYC